MNSISHFKNHELTKAGWLYFLFFILFVTGLLVRLLLAAHYYGNYDQESYEIVANIMQNGGNVYAETIRYNYSPFWSYLLLFLKNLSDYSSLAFHFVIRSFLTICDLILAILVGYAAHQNQKGSFSKAFLVYWLNPVAILIIGYHGQFDILALIPLMIAVILTKRENHKTPILWILILGTLSLIIKHITLFAVLLLFFRVAKNKIHGVILSIGSLAGFLLSFLPFLLTTPKEILNNVFRYSGIKGYYGFGSFLPVTIVFFTFLYVMALIVLIYGDAIKVSLSKAMKVIFVSFLALTPGISEQYFLLPIPWGSIHRTKLFWFYSIVVTLFLLSSDRNVYWLHIPNVWNTVWLAAVVWLIALISETYSSFIFPWKRKA